LEFGISTSYAGGVHFADRLTARVKETSPVCVGLDPRVEKLPTGVRKDAHGFGEFCCGIIDAVKGVASCVKPNLAFFEALQWEGMRVFFDVCRYAKEQKLIVIADGKRNDIGSTAEAYAEAYLSSDSPVDALTVSPYLGSDGVKPFIDCCVGNGKGIFVLVKTSNRSSGELQDLRVGDKAVHEHLAQLVESWGASCLGEETRLSCVGAVVGATYPEELTYLRTLMPHCLFLIPGYGAQGARAEDVKRGFLLGGTGAVANSSRSIIYASHSSDWQEAASRAARDMAREITEALAR
jgi:orotidine-5'-phosphate decarboxylase